MARVAGENCNNRLERDHLGDATALEGTEQAELNLAACGIRGMTAVSLRALHRARIACWHGRRLLHREAAGA